MRVRYDPLARLNSTDRTIMHKARDEILRGFKGLDGKKAKDAMDKLGNVGHKELEEMMGVGYRSHKAHVLVGLGNFKLGGKRGVELLFTPRDLDGNGGIRQDEAQENGDYHPLQSFAYSVMAGVRPEHEIPNIGMTLRTLAINSAHDMRTSVEWGDHDFGHLVFAASHLMPEGNFEFVINGKKTKLTEVVRRLLEATISEGEDGVCSRTHAIEGCMAATCMIREAAELRQVVQELVNAQAPLSYRSLVGTYTLSKRYWGIETAIMIENLINNVGHFVELSSYARIFGYSLPPESLASLEANLNLINDAILTSGWKGVKGCEHLRRGLTMKIALDKALREGRGTEIDLTEYAIDLD